MDALVVGEYFEFVGLPFDESCRHAGIMSCLGVKLNQRHHVGDVGRKSNRGVGRDKLAIHSLSHKTWRLSLSKYKTHHINICNSVKSVVGRLQL